MYEAGSTISCRTCKSLDEFRGEIGLDQKKWENMKARVAVAFPDVYEIAAQNLGIG